MTICIARELTATQQEAATVPQTAYGAEQVKEKEALRHILLGSPEAIRQTIHQLHVLNYVESLLWTPIMAVNSDVVITPQQGAAISLLVRSL
ncbi:hypothetical protein [cf. Phormidesmis sp. LEGE 11477]|uniref:hypothetical protein n=1 Tax=cf. Phormidesmis sp. LEGE 11477 TaxID=1828680 RepID=UPI0019EDFAD6|nr:hypothetical protein [cf. Phormidesmis sp. LEGE 11477]MBE9061648.1 hypothetical protein [cf. Phormidesmis sp. LEGE 11477]